MFSGRCPEAPRPFRTAIRRMRQACTADSTVDWGKYGTSLPAASRVAKLPVRKATCRGQDDHVRWFLPPADRDCASRKFRHLRCPHYTSGGGIDPGPRNSSGRYRDARLDRRPLKPFGAGSDRLSHARARGRRGGRTIGLRRGRPCAVHGQDARTGREAWPPAPMAFGRLP